MELGLPAVILALVLIGALLLFIIVRNRRDRKEMEEKMNQDYHKPTENEGDIDIEDKGQV